MEKSELTHYGVKGQKWGIRRFQNPDGSLTKQGKARAKGLRVKTKLAKDYLDKDVDPSDLDKHYQLPTDDIVFKKGSKVTHVTPMDFKKLRAGQDLFVSGSDEDKNLYRAFLTLKMRSKGFNTPIREVVFELNKDLKAPSDAKQKSVYEDVRSKNTKLFDDEMKERFGKEDYTYNDFVKALDKPSESKTRFVNALKSQGYNAVLDTHDISDTWIQAKTPLIVMDAVDTLGNMKVSEITNDRISKAIDELIRS